MKVALLGLFIIAAIAQGLDVATDRLDEPIKGELRIFSPRFLRPCELGYAVLDLSRQAHVPAGFESTPDCWLSPAPTSTPPVAATDNRIDVLTGMSMREAMDYVVALMPEYSWKAIDGVAIVRPKAAWNNPTSPLNAPTNAFSAANVPLNDVVHMLLDAASLAVPHEDVPKHRPIDRSITVAFPGGTMLEALNAVARAHGNTQWQLGYSGGHGEIVFAALDRDRGVVMAPVRLPQSHR
jgi:hypothetical protein